MQYNSLIRAQFVCQSLNYPRHRSTQRASKIVIKNFKKIFFNDKSRFPQKKNMKKKYSTTKNIKLSKEIQIAQKLW